MILTEFLPLKELIPTGQSALSIDWVIGFISFRVAPNPRQKGGKYFHVRAISLEDVIILPKSAAARYALDR